MTKTNFHILRSGYADYSNPCHNPPGPGGGQFCSGSGAKDNKEIKKVSEIKALGKNWIEQNGDLFTAFNSTEKVLEQDEIAGQLRARLLESSVSLAKVKDLNFVGEFTIKEKEKIVSAVNEMEKLTGEKIRNLSFHYEAVRPYSIGNNLHLNPNSKSVIFHEIGHTMESDKIYNLTIQYRDTRIVGPKVLKNMSQIISDENFSSKEKGYLTSCYNKYIGKVYQGKSTEVLSIGFEMISSASNFRALLSYDRDLAHFMIGILQTKKKGLL